ncbi:MAG: prepilin-type N-terminal cleavage/methylation domain-containing protein [Thioalkalivibrio sp.]|nr:prepilin-type N-terminal cleavage/methylation domain-containing protein [Thioalkalivibrio sp.]
MSPQKGQRAFSLVELMVAMTLGLLLIAGAVSLFLSVRQLQVEQERVATMKENLRFATDFMARDIRGAGLREGGVLDLAGALEPDDPDSETQQVFTVRKAGMNCLGETGPWVASVYSVHDNQLRCGNDASPPQNQPLVSAVRSMSAVAVDAEGEPTWEQPVALRVELELESQAGQQLLTHEVEFTVSLRNAVLAEHSSL